MIRRAGSFGFALVLAIAWMTAIPAFAAPGDLDPTFGGDGLITTHFAGGGAARGVALQPDGKIVAAGQTFERGQFHFVVARYGHDGSLDTTFGGDGKVTTDFKDGGIAYAVAVQPNGKIVVAGGSGGGFTIIRYRSNGALDPTFGRGGKVKTLFTGADAGGNAVALQDDGKIVVAGSAGSAFGLVRYDRDGSLDTSFDGDGRVTSAFAKGPASAQGVVVQDDGKIVAAGTVIGSPYSRLALARYGAHGALDPSFSGDGEVITHFTKGNDEGKAVDVQDDGKIVAAGTAGYCCEYTGSFGVARYDSSGMLDASFGESGKVITNLSSGGDAAFDIDVEADGRIVATGTAGYNGAVSAFAVARYLSDGTLDLTFGGGDGKVKTRFGRGLNFGVTGAIQGNQKIVLAGWTLSDAGSAFALARYLG